MSLSPVQQQAYDTVRTKLESSFLNPVTHNDVNDAAAALKTLNAADANAVISEMSKSGQLDRLASEGVDGTWFGNGGYSEGERQDLFNSLAGKLDGANLARVSNAFEGARSGEGGFDLAGEFASSVASHATSNQKVDYINALRGEATDGQGLRGAGIGGGWDRAVDGDAAAIGTVLGSLRGAQAERALAGLVENPDQLRAVLATGIDRSNQYSESYVTTSFDTSRFQGVMNAVASTGDADMKARVFGEGAEQLRAIRETPAHGLTAGSIDRSEALGQVRDSLTRVLDSDVTGVTRELTYNQETQDGSALASYTQQMFEAGKTDKLGEQLTRLQFGNDFRTNPQNVVDRLNTPVTAPDGTQRLENAGALGYFVGATQAGAEAQEKSVEAQQEDVTAMLKSANGIIGALTGPAGAAITAGGGEWIGKAVEAVINDSSKNTAQRLSIGTLPHQDVNPSPTRTDLERVPGPYFGEWNTQRNFVVDHAQP